MLLLKPGVRVAGLRPEILVAVIAAERVYEEAGYDLVVTAGIDGKHSTASLHYAGQTVDLRTRDVPEALPKFGITDDPAGSLLLRLRGWRQGRIERNSCTLP